MYYRKKPVTIEAHQLTAASREKISRWINGGESGRVEGAKNLRRCKAWFYDSNGDDEMYIETLEGVMGAVGGDWIIKGVEGEFYPCKPNIFAATYEPVSRPGHIIRMDESPYAAKCIEIYGAITPEGIEDLSPGLQRIIREMREIGERLSGNNSQQNK